MTKVQDTIQFDLRAETVVVNDTVRLTAHLVGMITAGTTEQAVRESIRAMMRKFIDTEWQFANMTRQAHASGQEEISLTATARVTEKENYALDRRREEASRDHDSVRIVGVSADTSPTMAQITDAQSKLRLALLKKAQDELKLINQAMDAKYRLGQVSFQMTGSDTPNYARVAAMASAPTAGKVAYGSGFSDADDVLGNAVKLTMQAAIQLRLASH
jgi:hypothetical protein